MALAPIPLDKLIYFQPNLKDCTLDDQDLEQSCPLDNGKHHINLKHDLGNLDALPVEILSMILIQIDLRTLTDFRRVNSRAMQVVDSILEYQLIIKHSPAALRGLLSIDLASHFSCQDLIRALYDPKCEDCGEFGGFIYLLTCRRVCFLCFCEKPKFYPLTTLEAGRMFGLDRNSVSVLPAFNSIAGRYSSSQNLCRPGQNLVDYEEARCKGIEHHGSVQAMEQYVTETWQKKMEAYQQSRLRRRPIIHARRGGIADTRRFMAIVRAPWIQESTNFVEWGFHCKGCERCYRERPMHWRIEYNAATFADHLEECVRSSMVFIVMLEFSEPRMTDARYDSQT